MSSDEADVDEESGETGVADASTDEEYPLFFWFFFPLSEKPDIAAWEASTGSGRATYFFRIDPAQPQQSIATLTRGLALVNFRREPIYLPDTSLETQQRFHRYAIGARRLPDLRALRSAYLGRAIHTSIEAWTAQVQSVVDRGSERGTTEKR